MLSNIFGDFLKALEPLGKFRGCLDRSHCNVSGGCSCSFCFFAMDKFNIDDAVKELLRRGYDKGDVMSFTLDYSSRNRG